ncbi:RRM domain protein [Trachipleistophora hominis]|uniref:RRM domain protein n=1 Tax=Trachipleistophora hominis TaxID=72359 RepID=L7K041_TRAHO|nr:RRM domain protein [Trachipleistophora hominis]
MEDKINKIFNTRTIRIENVPDALSITSIVDLIKDCELESIVIENGVYYLNFFEYFVFYIAYNELTKEGVLNKDIHISYVESGPMPENKLLAHQAGASRSIYFSNIDDDMDKEYFEDICTKHGEIENMKISKEKRHVQVRFYKFESAMSCMESLHKGSGKNRRYGFHRMKSYNKAFHCNRTLYLGNIQAEITASSVLNHCKGGAIFSIKFLREKKCAFLTFINPHAAEAFLYNCSLNPITIKKHRIKVTHGNNSNIPINMMLALYHGSTRSIKVKNIDDVLDMDQLESVYKDNGAVIYNFLSLYAATKAMENLRSTYGEEQVMYVPDRCGIVNSTEMMMYMQYNEFIKKN